MGKHATEGQKIAFCAHLQHVHLAEAARLAGLGSTVALRLKEQIGTDKWKPTKRVYDLQHLKSSHQYPYY